MWAVRRAMKTEAGQLTADRWMLKIPLIGEVARMVVHFATHEHAGHHVGERCAVVGCHGCREAGDE